MGDDEDMLSSNLTKTSAEDVNEQSMDNENSVVAELSNVGENLSKSDVFADSPLESNPNVDSVIGGNSENQDVGDMAVEAEIDTKEIMDEVVGSGDELLPKVEDSHGGLAEEAGSLGSDKEEVPKEDIEEKCDDEAGNEPVVEDETPTLGADLEMPTSDDYTMTTTVVDDKKLDGPDCATSVQETPTVSSSIDLTGGSAEIELSNTRISSSEPAFVVPQVAEMKASVDSGVGLLTVLEETSVTESKELQITAETSLDEDRGQKLQMDSLESSSVLTGGEDAPDAGAADLEMSVTVTDTTIIGGSVDAVEKDTAITDAKEATDSQTDADTAVELAEVIKEEQGIGAENFPAVSSKALAMSNEAEQDRGYALKGSLIADSETVEATGLVLSKDFEMRVVELGGDKQVIATGTEETEIKMEEEGVILVDAKDEIGESKVEIDQSENQDNDPDEDEESLRKLDDSENAEDDEEDEDVATGEEAGLMDTEQETETDVGESVKGTTDTEMETETYAGESGRAVGGKRKREKNSKAIANSKIVSRSRKTTDEDVCFICFDGGDLFICDRRGCGKAYHPSCVNRDEAFFRAKGRWNCGWHLCSKCEKNAYYMCYTCTFSLCKACVKDAVILCVRGNKGFCETCMRTVMLIENFDQSQQDAQIDLDDTTSWEFLFKDYYTDLKSKFSLSFAEISEAKNPWKGSDAVTIKEDISEIAVGANSNEGSGSDDHGEKQEARKPKRKKDKKRLKTLAKGMLSSAAASIDDGEGISLSGNTEWASKELLEFVMHMKDGDNSPVSPFDVQALLLEYIKRNKLRDPRRKSQIICDSRLQNLFGKPHVGHFEMLKLLESHFLVREDSQADDIQGSVVDTEANENAETTTKGTKDKKRKLRKRGTAGGPQYSRYEFAAINMHNINLIYLRRKLMEDLLEDTDEFSNKVVGTFVRIRISGNMQKQDLYRLVLVVGTSKAADPYKVGKRTTDTMLEILNLNKTEIVSIDSISNQDFTEEECKRLRQSIKCGLLNRMTVGDILDKAMELQEARVNDWLESEIMRLSHLRDRASDLGRKKELRECVEKLQILKTPEERLRRLEEVPQIHADPNMDPSHESEDDSEQENSRQVLTKSRSSSFSRRGNVQMSSGSVSSSKDSWNGGKFSSNNQDVHATFFTKNSTMGEDDFQSFDIVKDNSRNQRRDQEAPDDHYQKLGSPARPENAGWSSLPVARSDKIVGVGSVDSPVSVPAKHGVTVVSAVNPPTSLPTNEVDAVKVNETQKMWHYQDPSGKVQGPFSMVQLRKWSNTGYFPADLKIWKATDKQDNSVLLTEALAGRFPQELPSGASAISTSRSLLSDLSGKTSDISFQVAREQNHSAAMHDLKLSAEKLISNDVSNLPSPTPNRGNVGRSREEEIVAGANSYPVIVQSPVAALGRHASLPSAPTLIHNSAEQLMRGPESDSRNSDAGFASEQSAIGSVQPSQDSLLSAPAHLDAMEKHSDIPLPSATTNLGIQPVNSQNTQVGTRSWGAPPSQNLETNVSGPVPGTPQAYNHHGAIISTVQTPVASFSNSGSVLPQSAEYWRPPTQGDQSNMQPISNPTWGGGSVDPNSAALALGPGNSNMGWTPMHGVPNAGWLGPAPGAPNMNYGAVVQGPAGNANPGWIMANMNLAAPVQGPNMGNTNPCWFVPPGNPGVQGLGRGLVTAGWVPPANTVPAVQAPIPGNGWAMPNGSPGAPLQGSAPGNTNQGWNAQAGNQGTPGNGYQDGGQYSGQRDRGSQSRDSTFGGGRGWTRQQSFGRGGAGGPLRSKRDTMCPYNNQGRCRKGAACDYRHA